mmetsp:Transcript_5683/g.12334  ORF Transcript_5683/g.12334 Transcript_5683/m.12334 type:complete len:388 (-) Transcript_5683:119-1282(-)
MSTSGSRGSRRPFQDDVEDTALGCGEEQRKKPRLEGEQADDPHTSSTIGLDLACQVASFMNVEGSGLYNFCVAFGPEGAAEIRRDYLLDNEAYIEHNLEIVTNSVLTTRDAMLLMPQEDLSEGLAAVDKCKRNTMTWMEVNGNWKERVTAERMELYKRYTIAHERHAGTHDADAVFNNIAVAVEIGLLDVVRHLIEEKKVDVNSIKYVGFHKGVVGVRHLVGRALIRGDATMIHYLMSQDGCRLRNPSTNEDKSKCWYFVRTLAEESFVEPEYFKLFLDVAGFDVNIFASSPVLASCLRCFGRTCDPDSSPTPVRTLARQAHKIEILVDFGADPFSEYYDFISRQLLTPLQFARDRLKHMKQVERCPLSWRLWEQLIEKMEAVRVSE